jgi:hypothetical protein
LNLIEGFETTSNNNLRKQGKALQTVSRFTRETRRRFAEPKSNAFTLLKKMNKLDTNIIE